jgi:hypothetical protein
MFKGCSEHDDLDRMAIKKQVVLVHSSSQSTCCFAEFFHY